MVTIALIVFGLVAATRLPVELLPNLTYPSLTVSTRFPDAAPLEVEELVTRPVEELVGAVPGIVGIDSVSREGESEVVLDFAWGTRIDTALAEVREKLDRVRLPNLAERSVVLRYDPSQEAIIRLGLVVENDTGLPEATLRRLADKQVKRAIEKTQGVAAVQILGGDQEEIRVELMPDRLNALGISAQEVVSAISSDHVNRPGGALTQDGNRYLLRTLHEAKTPEELGQLVVRAKEQAYLRLRDVAKIARVPLEREESFWVDGKSAIELAVYREGDANTVSVARAVLRQVQTMPLPAGTRLVVLSNQAQFIENAVTEVINNILLGGVFSIAVLLFFLRKIRPTLVLAVAIPISLLITFIALLLLDVSLNLMSLGGLALGVGMLVDNGIVVLEAIDRVRLEMPELSRRQSAWEGSRQVAAAVVASTLTTVAVFLPMVFVEGIAGQLVRDLGYAVSFSILASMVVSLSLVPVLVAAGMPSSMTRDEADLAIRKAPLAWIVAVPAWIYRNLLFVIAFLAKMGTKISGPGFAFYDRIEAIYPPLLRAGLRAPALVVVLGILLFGGALLQGQRLGRSLLPETHQGEFYVQIEMPPGTSLERSEAIAQKASLAVLGDQFVDVTFARVGSLTQAASASGSLRGTHYAQVQVRLKNVEAIPAWQELWQKIIGERESIEGILAAREREMVAHIEQALANSGAKLRSDRPALIAADPPLSLEIFSEDLDAARLATDALRDSLRQVPGIHDIAGDDTLGRPELALEFDRLTLSRMGLDVSQCASAVQRAVQGEVAGVLHTADDQLNIRVQLPRVDRSRIDDVKRISVAQAGGRPVLLSSVAKVEESIGPAEIRRINGRRGLRLSAQISGEDLDAPANAVRELIASFPANPQARAPLAVQLGGQASTLGGSLNSLAFTTALSLFLVYVVMASTFESLLHPLLIMFTVPLAAIGVVAACTLVGLPISVMVGIGCIILGGVVVNNAIVLVSAVNELRAQGQSVGDALIAAGRMRLRPIVMTTATTVLGLLPMGLGLGDGAALRQPLAVSILGGLLLSTLLTLIVIPCVYRLFPGRTPVADDEV
jgi:HAE1 family hydrophobic/amphiphilic exporter-1